MIDLPKPTTWNITCESTPYQVEGTLSNGMRFYFRYRFGRAGVGLATADGPDDPVADHFHRAPKILHEDEWRGWFDNEAEARYVFEQALLARLEAGRLPIPPKKRERG